MILLPDFPEPHRAGAFAQLARVQPDAYARSRNFLQGAVTRLSPYICHGILTLPEVLQCVLQNPNLSVLPIEHKLVYELGWRAYFQHVWATEGDRIFYSFHAGPLDDSHYAQALPDDIVEARTGIPAIDMAVRTLYLTGYLHNHARMWLASYIVHMRKVHWRTGADWMVAHLLDGDLASNHLSWQWVAGTGSHKPYLFNADNVERYAPAPWHSPKTVIDTSYEQLDLIARSTELSHQSTLPITLGLAQTPPDLWRTPPPHLPLRDLACAQSDAQHWIGKRIWLVHPWAIHEPPAAARADAVIGIYLSDYHPSWPWTSARWHWVDQAMSEITPQRYWLSAQALSELLRHAASVQGYANLHIQPWLAPMAQLEPQPTLFEPLPQRCRSFSIWWKKVIQGKRLARDLFTESTALTELPPAP